MLVYDSDDSEDEDTVEISMKFPKATIDRISYILLFPLHFLIFIMPNYHKDPSIKKLVLCFLFNGILI